MFREPVEKYLVIIFSDWIINERIPSNKLKIVLILCCWCIRIIQVNDQSNNEKKL